MKIIVRDNMCFAGNNWEYIDEKAHPIVWDEANAITTLPATYGGEWMELEDAIEIGLAMPDLTGHDQSEIADLITYYKNTKMMSELVQYITNEDVIDTMVNDIIEPLSDRGDVMEADKYCEPGYEQPKAGILFANWNNVDDWKQELLKKAGYELEWSDEWVMCSDCNGAVRTSPTSYGWTQNFWEHPCGDILCGDCVKKSYRDEYIEYMCEHSSHAMMIEVDTTGWERIGEIDDYRTGRDNEIVFRPFENGWYGGQDADPKKIKKFLKSHGIGEVFFEIASVGQFDISFWAYVPTDELPLATSLMEMAAHGDISADEDPADVLKRGLENASKAMAQMTGDGIKTVSIDGNGEAKAKLITPEQFVKGDWRDEPDK